MLLFVSRYLGYRKEISPPSPKRAIVLASTFTALAIGALVVRFTVHSNSIQVACWLVGLAAIFLTIRILSRTYGLRRTRN